VTQDQRRGLLAGAVLLLGSTVLFAVGLSMPEKPSFDEFHYIPAAREFLALNVNRNYEHPPLGKYFIALGMAVFGDNPVGWRALSVVFGSITLGAVYAASWALFSSWGPALLAATLVLFSNTLFVQARIAMLDTFLAAFLMLAAAMLAWAYRSHRGSAAEKPRARAFLYAAGVMLGAATACKWFGLVPWASVGLGGVLLVGWEHRQGRKQALRLRDVLLSLGVVPALVYGLTFVPLVLLKNAHYDSVASFFKLHAEMWAGQQQVGTKSHGYASSWYEWPLMLRPIWYFWETDASGRVIGQILLGNALVMWGGLLALGHLVYRYARERAWSDAAIVGAWAVLALSWGLLPRKLGFYYYYYPASLVLGVACAAALRSVRRRWVVGACVVAVIALFVFDYPVLAASPTTYGSAMMRIWFRRWI